MLPRLQTCERCGTLNRTVPGAVFKALKKWAAGLKEASRATVLLRAASELARLTSADRASILIPAGPNALRVVASSDTAGLGDLVIFLDRYPELKQVADHGEEVLIPHVPTSELLEPVLGLLNEAGVVSIAAAPFKLAEVSGIMRVVSRSRPLSQVELEILRAAAHLAEHALGAAQAELGGGDSETWSRITLEMADVVIEMCADGQILDLGGRGADKLPDQLKRVPLEDLIPELSSGRMSYVDILDGSLPAEGQQCTFCAPASDPTPARLWSVPSTDIPPRARIAVRFDDSGREAEARSFLRNAPVPMAVLDSATQTVVDFNHRLAELTGLAAAEILGHPLSSLITTTGDGPTLVAGTMAPVPVQVLLSPPTQVGGELTAAFIDLRPFSISTRREAQLRSTVRLQMEELELLHKQLEELQIARTRFLSASAHELKTPLTVIQSYLEALLADLSQGMSDEQVSFLRITYDSVLRLRRLVVDLVDLAALQSGKIQLDITRVPLRPLIATVIDEMGALARNAGVELSLEQSPDLVARADTVRLQQVLRNLVDNAIKYTLPGGRVTVVTSHDKDSAVLHVKDTGIGIPADQLPSVFEEFVQARRPPGSRRHGSGLGLSICRRIVLALGGRITASSIEGEGTTFSVFLPLWPDDA
jgi:signal transduction histidine kinase